MITLEQLEFCFFWLAFVWSIVKTYLFYAGVAITSFSGIASFKLFKVIEALKSLQTQLFTMIMFAVNLTAWFRHQYELNQGIKDQSFFDYSCRTYFNMSSLLYSLYFLFSMGKGIPATIFLYSSFCLPVTLALLFNREFLWKLYYKDGSSLANVLAFFCPVVLIIFDLIVDVFTGKSPCLKRWAYYKELDSNKEQNDPYNDSRFWLNPFFHIPQLLVVAMFPVTFISFDILKASLFLLPLAVLIVATLSNNLTIEQTIKRILGFNLIEKSYRYLKQFNLLKGISFMDRWVHIYYSAADAWDYIYDRDLNPLVSDKTPATYNNNFSTRLVHDDENPRGSFKFRGISETERRNFNAIFDHYINTLKGESEEDVKVVEKIKDIYRNARFDDVTSWWLDFTKDMDDETRFEKTSMFVTGFKTIIEGDAKCAEIYRNIIGMLMDAGSDYSQDIINLFMNNKICSSYLISRLKHLGDALKGNVFLRRPSVDQIEAIMRKHLTKSKDGPDVYQNMNKVYMLLKGWVRAHADLAGLSYHTSVLVFNLSCVLDDMQSRSNKETHDYHIKRANLGVGIVGSMGVKELYSRPLYILLANQPDVEILKNAHVLKSIDWEPNENISYRDLSAPEKKDFNNYCSSLYMDFLNEEGTVVESSEGLGRCLANYMKDLVTLKRRHIPSDEDLLKYAGLIRSTQVSSVMAPG